MLLIRINLKIKMISFFVPFSVQTTLTFNCWYLHFEYLKLGRLSKQVLNQMTSFLRNHFNLTSNCFYRSLQLFTPFIDYYYLFIIYNLNAKYSNKNLMIPCVAQIEMKSGHSRLKELIIYFIFFYKNYNSLLHFNYLSFRWTNFIYPSICLIHERVCRSFWFG